MITVGVGRGDVSEIYSKVRLAATTRCRYCEPEEDGLPVYVASEPKTQLRALWPKTKSFD